MTNDSRDSVAQVTNPLTRRCDVVGDGRMGRALSASLRAAGIEVNGPLKRGANGAGAGVVLLCVPDRSIGEAAAAVDPGPLVGHVSASTPLDVLAPHERFTMHPLLSVAAGSARFDRVTCAVDGSTPAALGIAIALAERLHMRPRLIESDRRAAYHAAASVASNYIITILGMAEQLAETVGLDRAALQPLVQSAVDQWAARGAQEALTGPIARGDELTVARQRAAVEHDAPELLPLWDALADGTRGLIKRT